MRVGENFGGGARGIFPRPCTGELDRRLPARWRFGVLNNLKYRLFSFETPVKQAKKLIHF